MKIFGKFPRILAALIFSALILYCDIIYSYPDEIIMYNGLAHSTAIGAGVKISGIPDSKLSSDGTTLTPTADGKFEATLSAGGKIPLRTITVNVKEPQSVYASGSLVGLRIYNRGLLVTQTTKFVSTSGMEASPAQRSGIMAGDIILRINGVIPESSMQVCDLLTEGENIVELSRDNRSRVVIITPLRDINDNVLKLGVWVRDSTAGVGTMTYYEPDTLKYGALGHGISDIDTGVMFDIAKGTVEKSSVVSVKKGERGNPGEICGSFSSGAISGTVEKNCDSGIFGRLTSANIEGKLYPIGLIGNVKTGNAQIISTVDDSPKMYDIKILRTMPFGSATKGLMIKITDEELLKKTGGIVQGMSGSPIIQDGKIIGAVTHVLVNDPTCGYGIYLERMLSAS